MAPMPITLDDDLQRPLQQKAAQEGRTVHSLANGILRGALAAESTPGYRLKQWWAAQDSNL